MSSDVHCKTQNLTATKYNRNPNLKRLQTSPDVFDEVQRPETYLNNDHMCINNNAYNNSYESRCSYNG